MMFSMGPVPDHTLIESRPENVSAEAAVGAWHAAYSDARNGREYHIFPSDAEELQSFYENGYERGERDKLYMQRITERLGSGAPESDPRASESDPISRLRAAMARTHTVHEHLLVNSELVQAAATILVAAAILLRRSNR